MPIRSSPGRTKLNDIVQTSAASASPIRCLGRLCGSRGLPCAASLVHGKRYLKARRVLASGPGKDSKAITDALQELARQGKLSEAALLVSIRKTWSSQPPRTDYDFQSAALAAAELATASKGQEQDDIRLNIRCMRYGRCDFQYGYLADQVPPQKLQEAQALAESMADAMRAGDVDRLFGHAKNGTRK